MNHVLIIGTGEVAKAAAIKLSKVSNCIITLAARDRDKLESLKKSCIKSREYSSIYEGYCAIYQWSIDIYEDAKSFEINLRDFGIDTVINLGSPYLNLKVMNACLQAGCNYIDTSAYEPKDTKGFSYKEQLGYEKAFEEEGLTAILGAGGSPGVTNLFAARMARELSELNVLHIADINAGHQGEYEFCTNFSPEDNLKELDNSCIHWENGQWIFSDPFSNKDYNKKYNVNLYQIYHEELESLVNNIPTLTQARSWMSFSDSYIEHLLNFKRLGFLNHDPSINIEGKMYSPINLLGKMLPHPSKVAQAYQGKASISAIGRYIEKDLIHREVKVYEWVMDHEECYKDTGTGAVAWSTGVPAIAFAQMLEETPPGVYNVEQLDIDSAIDKLYALGLDINFEADIDE